MDKRFGTGGDPFLYQLGALHAGCSDAFLIMVRRRGRRDVEFSEGNAFFVILPVYFFLGRAERFDSDLLKLVCDGGGLSGARRTISIICETEERMERIYY